MKSKFRGFYKEFLSGGDLLKDAAIVVDTNVLLDIYRYSKETANQILKMMDSLKEQLWMPFQVAYEYHKDRNEKVLGGHVRTYSQFIKTIDELDKTFAEERKHPFLEDADIIELKQNIQNIRDILCQGRSNCAQLIKDDEYKNWIAKLYEGKLGDDYDSDVKNKYILDAHSRYEKHIPPGYKDSSKNDNECGDYLIWRQMIDYSKSSGKPIIFVSNDLKEDWIEDVAGIKIGPRPELIDEFFQETNQWFYCYNLNHFVEIVNSQIVTKEAKAEIESRIREETLSTAEPVVGEAVPMSSPVEVYTGDTENNQSVSEV